MTDKYFLDSNVLIYAHSDLDLSKQAKAQKLIDLYVPTISIQVLNEFANIFHKKFKTDWKIILDLINELSINTVIFNNSISTVVKAIELSQKTGYTYYDAQILAAAIESGCNILFSEDMQNRQIIENKLKILNPFL